MQDILISALVFHTLATLALFVCVALCSFRPAARLRERAMVATDVPVAMGFKPPLLQAVAAPDRTTLDTAGDYDQAA